MRLFLLLILALPAIAQKHPEYEAWRQSPEPFIRVGLEKPMEVVRLSASGPLLVLDGEKVVQTIRPDGEFRVIMGKGPTGLEYWVQIQAAYNEKVLAGARADLRKLYPELKLIIVQTTPRLMGLRIGPVPDSGAAESLRRKMVEAGFSDAFPVKISQGRFFWVDRNFDKFPLETEDPAFVLPDPELPIGFAGKSFRGLIRLHPVGNQMQVINELPLETYLRGVVPSEMGPRVYPEVEALKAQAVAARTYVLKNIRRFDKKGYDICDGPACQAYDGTRNEMALSDEAVAATRGLVMYYEDQLIDALYTSTGGGHTEDVENVFPGRAEPYLRGKSEYLAEYQGWTLPQRSVPEFPVNGHGHLAALCLIYGFEQVPDLQGQLNLEFMDKALKSFSWILGESPRIAPPASWTHASFWRLVSELPLFQTTVADQVNALDAARLLNAYPSIPAGMDRFAAFLLRYDLIDPGSLNLIGANEPISRQEAIEFLLNLCARMGPEPEWTRYYLEGFSNNRLQVRQGFKPEEISLDGIQWYLEERGGKMALRKEVLLEERDRLYTLLPPFPNKFLKIRQNGGVASIDRFSAFDYWIEKKTLLQLEKRAQRYFKGLRGIRDIKIIARSKTGRVTELQYICDSGTYTATGLTIRWSLDIKDNLFDLVPSYQKGKLVHMSMVGRGWGHGVGMSQVGAYGMARMGWDFQKILNYYYSDIQIKPYPLESP